MFVAKQPIETTPILVEQPQEEITYNEFKKQYPKMQGELYGSSERYKTVLDWADIASKYEQDYDL